MRGTFRAVDGACQADGPAISVDDRRTIRCVERPIANHERIGGQRDEIEEVAKLLRLLFRRRDVAAGREVRGANARRAADGECEAARSEKKTFRGR